MRAILVVIAVIAAPAAAAGQPAAGQPAAEPAAPPRGERLTLGAAVELALGKSPDLAISQESVESARHRVKSSQRRRLPAVSVEARS